MGLTAIDTIVNIACSTRKSGIIPRWLIKEVVEIASILQIISCDRSHFIGVIEFFGQDGSLVGITPLTIKVNLDCIRGIGRETRILCQVARIQYIVLLYEDDVDLPIGPSSPPAPPPPHSLKNV